MKLNGKTTNQNRCVKGTCTNERLRDSGCFLCSNGTSGNERCVTCIEDHIFYYWTCVECLSTEVCPFNNYESVECANNDYSHCGFGSIGCRNHKCDMRGIPILIGCVAAFIVVSAIAVVIVCLVKKKSHNDYSQLSQDPL